MHFNDLIKGIKRIHINERKMSLLSKLLENAEDEGGILNVYDIDKTEEPPLLKATYKYIPYNDGIYADFSNFKGDDSDIVNANAGRQQKIVNLGVGDTIKNKLEPDILKVDGEPIKCYNLTMLGDDNTRVMIAHIYKGKPSPYPKNPSYSIVATDVEDSKKMPNYFKGESEYLKKINNVISGCDDLMKFNPTYIIYPESSSDFNGQLMEYLKNNFFPNAECLGNNDGRYAMPKNDVWGINFNALVYNGMKEIMGYSNYRKYYSKNAQTRNIFKKEYFLKQLTAIFEPQIARLIPQIRKQYFLEKRSTVDLDSFYREKTADQSKNKANETKFYALSNYGKLLLEASSAFVDDDKINAEIDNTDINVLRYLNSLGLTRIEVRDLFQIYPGFSRMPFDKIKEIANDFVEKKNYLNSNFDKYKEKQVGERLVSLEDIPEIEEKYMSPKQRGKMNSFVRDPKSEYGKSNMDSNEREYLIDFLHGYFMGEMEKFDEAAEKFNLAFSFQVPPFGEELLLNIYRKLLSRRGTTKGGVSKNKELKFGNYNSFVKSFIAGKDKDGDFFSFNMPKLSEIANKSIAIKDYSLAARLSFLSQFRLDSNTKKKIEDNIKDTKEMPRFLVIDDNFSSGVSLRNAAKAIHEAIGVPYSNIMALTPGDMGQPSSGSQKYEQNPIFNAEGYLHYLLNKCKENSDNFKNSEFLIRNYLGLDESNETDREIIKKIASLNINHKFSNSLRDAQFGNLTKGSSKPFSEIERPENLPFDDNNEIIYASKPKFGKPVASSEMALDFNTDTSKPHITVLWLDNQRSPQEYFQNRKGENGLAKSRNLAKYYEIGRHLYMDFEWATNFGEFVLYIEKNGLPDMVSFDFDIVPQIAAPKVDVNTQRKNGIIYTSSKDKGNRVMINGVGYPNNGKGCAEWLVNYCKKTGQKLPECYSQSANKTVYNSLTKIYEDAYEELGVERLSDKYPVLNDKTIEFDDDLANRMRGELEQSRIEYEKNGNKAPTAKEYKLKANTQVSEPSKARGRKSYDAETLRQNIRKYEPLLKQLTGYEKYKVANNINRWKSQLAKLEGNNPSSTVKLPKVAADSVQRTPTPIAKKGKVNISKPLSNQEKQVTRANLLNNIGKLNVNISNLDKKIRSYPLSHPDRTTKVKELENLKYERERLRKEIERLTTNYG